MRVFSGLSIETGPNEAGVTAQARVPIVYGDSSWMVAQIMKGQSQNTTLPSPMMSAWIAGLQMAPERRRDPAYEGTINSIERKFENGAYTNEVGSRTTIERYMPVPYTLTFQLDIWTTTTTTKLQILEQIMTVFNPAVQLQQNQNFYDWTNIFEVEMEQITWSNRAIGAASEAERDVASFQFKVPIFINPPAKMKRINMIEQIVTNIHSVASIDKSLDDPLSCLTGTPEQIIVTPGNYMIGVGTNGLANNEIMLLSASGAEDSKLTWESLISAYGSIEPDSSLLRLKLDTDIEDETHDILGTIAIHPTKPNVLIYNIDVDTLPATIGPISKIIDPTKDIPGKSLPAATTGQRYLLTAANADNEEGAIPLDTIAWGTFQAWENDIIEYNGTEWFVSFDSRAATSEQNVVSLSSNNMYTFNGEDWSFTYLGEYFPGYWRLENINAGNGFDEDNENGGGDTFPLCPDS